jgi:NitT/TauT family transport system permease protein
VLALVCLWEASVRFEIVESLNWPPFSAVALALFDGLVAGELGPVIGSTLWCTLGGYAIGAGFGVVTGFAVALPRPVPLTIGPTIEILRTAVADLLNRAFVAWEAHVIHWARTREAAWSEQ